MRAPDARFACSPRQTRLGSGSFWARSHPVTAVQGDARLRWASTWQRSVDLHVLYADGALLGAHLDQQALARHIRPGALLEYDLPERAAPPLRVLWRVTDAANARGVVLGATIVSERRASEADIALAALYGAFAGLCVALLVYNLALWAALRHSFQLAYCGLLATLLIYAASSSGALAWAVEGVANNDRMRVNYLSLSLAAIGALTFARCFFGPAIFSGWLRWAARGAVVVIAVVAAALQLLAPTHLRLLDPIFAASLALVLLLVVPVLWRAWRHRSDYLLFFALAWITPIVLSVLRAACNFRLIPWSFWLDNSTLIAMSIEALLSSVAVALRLRSLADERDAARNREVAARLLADVDPLTGLLNRRALLREAVTRTGMQTLHLLDLDHFKQVNSAIGHDGGDEVLRVVARVLRRVAPSGALIARLGGEEFVLLGPSLPTGDTILEALRAERMPHDRAITASIGSAAASFSDDAGWKRLYAAADRALFDAKASGRDCARAA